jgi:hypothetical protein
VVHGVNVRRLAGLVVELEGFGVIDGVFGFEAWYSSNIKVCLGVIFLNNFFKKND